MDNNRFIGFTLIMLLILTYYTFFPPGQVSPEVENQSENIVQESKVLENNFIENSPKSKINEDFISNTAEEKFKVENDVFEITFNNRGAKIIDVKLKDYFKFNGENVNLINDELGDFNFTIDSRESINFNEIIFEKEVINSNDKKSIIFSAVNRNQGKISIVYEIGEGYLINSKILINGSFQTNSNLKLLWTNNLLHQESNSKNEKNQTRINYYTKEGDFDYTSATSINKEDLKVEQSLEWVSFKQQFFSSALISENNFFNSSMTSEYIEGDEFNKNFLLDTNIPFVNNSITLNYFFGPNKYSIIKDIDFEFHNNLYLGWIGVGAFNRNIIVPVFNLLENITSNYGLIILFMVILIRVVVTPLTYKSHLSMAKMKVLNPEIQEIRKKHDGDMQKSQSEIMELYQKTGVSPLGGCLPILFQLPILVSVFYFLPNAIELRGKSFLWATDLSNFDSILTLPFNIPFYGDHISLFTILMTVSTILINKANSQMQTMEGPMKTFQYVLPIMFLFIFNNFSSGLTYYYFLSNVASYAQIFIFKRFVDEEKIKKEIDFNRKKNLNTKKSSFQLRLEEAMKARQEKKNK